jgi:hypothetical protein
MVSEKDFYNCYREDSNLSTYNICIESCGLREIQLREKYKHNFDVSSEGPPSSSKALARIVEVLVVFPGNCLQGALIGVLVYTRQY